MKSEDSCNMDDTEVLDVVKEEKSVDEDKVTHSEMKSEDLCNMDDAEVLDVVDVVKQEKSGDEDKVTHQQGDMKAKDSFGMRLGRLCQKNRISVTSLTKKSKRFRKTSFISVSRTKAPMVIIGEGKDSDGKTTKEIYAIATRDGWLLDSNKKAAERLTKELLQKTFFYIHKVYVLKDDEINSNTLES
jgi:hypothetical protein